MEIFLKITPGGLPGVLLGAERFERPKPEGNGVTARPGSPSPASTRMDEAASSALPLDESAMLRATYRVQPRTLHHGKVMLYQLS